MKTLETDRRQDLGDVNADNQKGCQGGGAAHGLQKRIDLVDPATDFDVFQLAILSDVFVQEDFADLVPSEVSAINDHADEDGRAHAPDNEQR
jgi:hypothetical protein